MHKLRSGDARYKLKDTLELEEGYLGIDDEHQGRREIEARRGEPTQDESAGDGGEREAGQAQGKLEGP